MFTDEPSPFKPRSDSGWPVTAVVLAVFAGFGAYTYLFRVPAQSEAPKTRSRTVPSHAAMPAAPTTQLDADRQRQMTLAVAPSPELIAPLAAPSAVISDARTTIYLCKGYSGGTFWSDRTCRTQRATIDRMMTVPARLPFDQQVAIARGEAREAARLYETPQPVSAAAIELAEPARNRPSICAIYDQQVRELEAEARRPLPASRQDQIRADRMNVMSARLRERCWPQREIDSTSARRLGSHIAQAPETSRSPQRPES